MGLIEKIKNWIFSTHCVICKTKLDHKEGFVIIQYKCLDGYDNMYLCDNCAEGIDESAFDSYST